MSPSIVKVGIIGQGRSGRDIHGNLPKPEEAPHQELTTAPIVDANGMPGYCRENLTWYTDSWNLELPEGMTEFESMTEQLYLMLHRALVNGDELEITLQQVRQQMAVMAECRRQNPQIYRTLQNI